MIEEILKKKEQEFEKVGYLTFSKKELTNLDDQKVQQIENHFHGFAMMKFPDDEITFFKWLKEVDRPVWEDLWGEVENPYYVSIDFLHHFLERGNGFPICDLVSEDNYWFCVKHIKAKGLEQLAQINEKIGNQIQLSLEEILITEIMQGSIDIWHFCFRYNLPLDEAKKKVAEMKHADVLVHLTHRDDLVKYLDI